MQEAIFYLGETGKQKDKQKVKNLFPTIKRADIMSGILSPDINDEERSKLSNLYAEIISMEKVDLKYISEITVSSPIDIEIYEMLRKLNKLKKQI